MSTANEPATDAEEAEAGRLSKRESVRQQLQDIASRCEIIEDCRGALQLLDRRSDEAADKHQAETAPLQNELAKLAGDPVHAARRRELQAEVTIANARLEQAVQINKQSQSAIHKKISAIQIENREHAVLQNRLCGELANPSLAGEYFVERDRLQWSQARVKQASQELEKVRGFQELAARTQDYGGPQAYTRRVRECGLVFDDASQAVSESQRRCAELRQQMLAD